MNVFIMTDLEGVPGATTIDAVKNISVPEAYAHACRMLEKTLNWVVETCLENGAENIYFYDGHGGGGNIQDGSINPRATKVTIEEWSKLLQEGKIDCHLEVGAHARAGTLGGFLDHTFNSSAIFEYRLNGEPCSELSLVAALCGCFDVPSVLCIGDRVGCEQAKEYIPEIRTAIVKEGTERNVCQDLPNAEQIVREATADALKNYKSIPPYKLSFPITVQQTSCRTDMADRLYAKIVESGQTVERVDARTLRKTVTEVTNYFDLRFWA